MKTRLANSSLAAALLGLAGLTLLNPSAGAQGLPAAPGSFVSVQLGCSGTTLVWGQLSLQDSCTFNPIPTAQGTLSAFGSNLGGILRARTAADVDELNLVATSDISWEDRLTFVGGVLPASAVFQFQLAGAFEATAQGQSTGSINDAGYQAFVRPFGSWGTSAASASGRLGQRQVLNSLGPAISESVTVLQDLTLPVSLLGVAVGNSLELSTRFVLSSQASAARDGLAQASADFSNSAGLVDLRFFDAQGTDITPLVQVSWQWGTQFVTAVPEPGTLWLMLAGLGLAGMFSALRAGGGPARPAPQGPRPTARPWRVPRSGW